MPLDFAADPVFGQFAPWSGAAKAGFHAGYLGEMTDARFIEPGGRLFHKIGANADPGRQTSNPGRPGQKRERWSFVPYCPLVAYYPLLNLGFGA